MAATNDDIRQILKWAVIHLPFEDHRQQALDVLLDFAEVHGTIDAQDVLAVKQLCRGNKRLLAIKHIRTITGLGLKEAKAMCDAIEPYTP